MTNISILNLIRSFECLTSRAFADLKHAAHFYIGQVLRAGAG